MKLFWRFDIDGTGLAYGYAKSGRAIKEALARRGVEFCDDADVALSFVAADVYSRADDAPVANDDGLKVDVNNTWGKYRCKENTGTGTGFKPAPTREYLFTMFESNILPEKFAEGLRRADQIICPSMHNRDVFKRYAGGRPVHLCRLGIDPELYKYRERHYPSLVPSPSGRGRGEGDKFRFLWIGSKSLRKGWDLLGQAFQAEFRPDEPVELFIKTTGGDEGRRKLGPNVIYEDREYSEHALLNLYYSAHAFIFPTRGEGFGLPAIEALSTGCLVIAPKVYGLAEFIRDKSALVVKHGWVEVSYNGAKMQSPNCDLTDLRQQMRRAFRDYGNLKRKAAWGAKYVKNRLTWDHTAKRLIEIMWGQTTGRDACATKSLGGFLESKSQGSRGCALAPLQGAA